MSMPMTLSRRQFLSGTTATALVLATPFRARAEPTTVLAAGAAVVGIIGGVAGFVSDARKEALLQEISGKLNTVIRNQEVIISEIRALRVYIDEALYRSFRDAAVVRMNAHQDRYEVLIADKPTGNNRAEYLGFAADVSQTALELGNYDVPAYIAYGAGVAWCWRSIK